MPRVAVLIDAENIAVQFAPAIIQRARSLGDLNIVRLFGDFTEIRLSGWLDVARVAGYDPMLQLSGGRAKNSADIALAIDAMDILYGGAIDAFCLVSDDRDFVPLASRLRAADKRVFAICRRSDERLSNVCSEVFPLLPAAPAPAQREHPVIDAYRRIAAGHSGDMTLAAVALALRKHAPELIPTKGKGTIRKLLRATGRFDEIGEGSALRIRLKG